jgi:hypothetical protein
MQQSKVFDDLRDIWWTTKSSKEREKFAIRVRGSGRCSTIADIPKVSPYDFGINFEWLNEARMEHPLEERLKDWGKYGDPIRVEEYGAAAAASEGDNDDDAMTTDGGGERDSDRNMGGAEQEQEEQEEDALAYEQGDKEQDEDGQGAEQI